MCLSPHLGVVNFAANFSAGKLIRPFHWILNRWDEKKIMNTKAGIIGFISSSRFAVCCWILTNFMTQYVDQLIKQIHNDKEFLFDVFVQSRFSFSRSALIFASFERFEFKTLLGQFRSNFLLYWIPNETSLWARKKEAEMIHFHFAHEKSKWNGNNIELHDVNAGKWLSFLSLNIDLHNNNNLNNSLRTSHTIDDVGKCYISHCLPFSDWITWW